MVARRKNGLEVHSSRLQPAIGIMGVSLELPLSNFNLLQLGLLKNASNKKENFPLQLPFNILVLAMTPLYCLPWIY